jgi:hypothetical protein
VNDRDMIAVNSALSMLGIELSELTEHLAAVENALQESLSSDRSLSSSAMAQLQSIDLVSQTLAALSGFTLSLAGLVATDVEVDASQALESITLSKLASRLRGESSEPAIQIQQTARKPEIWGEG